MEEAWLQCQKNKKNSTNVQTHNVLGKLYGLEITKKWNGHEEKQVRGEENIVSDKFHPMSAGHPKAILHAGVSREDKKAAMEAIRAEKARATQQARDAKQNMALCQKFLHRSTKVSFKLGKGLPPKFKRDLPVVTKNKMDAITARLATTQKALMNTMKSGGKVGLEKEEVEKAVADSEMLLEQLVGAAQMI